MRIKMLTLDAGPKGVRRPGQIINVDTAEARELIQARSAVECDERGEPLAREDRRERATFAPPENAAKDKGGERKGKPDGKGDTKPENAAKDKGGDEEPAKS